MGFNVYLGPLVQADDATSISTISLVDVNVESFSSYIYQPTPWAKHTKTTIWGAPSLGNPSCSKLDFSRPSLVVAVAVAVAVAVLLLLRRRGTPRYDRYPKCFPRLRLLLLKAYFSRFTSKVRFQLFT